MLIKKPPIVVVLGHIDHGKTTLLDALRKTNLALREAGGITQKIGAYEITFDKEKITFLDTPGHEAFNLLRQRGVKVADLGILVIAADEGVKEQTKESLEYLKAADLPFLIALTKIDKKEADPQKVISQLIELGTLPEKWGGEVPVLEVSAPQGKGLNELLETLILLRDIHNLKIEIEKPGRGFILEAMKDLRRGILASGIVIEGKVNYGDYLITKTAFCKIKIFEDEWGKKIEVAYPSKPFLAGNFNFLPLVGEEFEIGREEDLEKIQEKLRQSEEAFRKKLIFQEGQGEGNLLILKADHVGSLEALENIFQKIAKQKNVNLKIIKTGLGSLNFEDLNLAKELGAILVSFNLKTPKQILEMIKNFDLDLIESNIIYELEEKFLDYLEKEKEKALLPKGELEVLATFGRTRTKKTIGGRVILGKLKINQKIFILRNDEKIGQGRIISLERNKIPVEEVKENETCGLVIETTKDIEVGDKIVA